MSTPPFRLPRSIDFQQVPREGSSLYWRLLNVNRPMSGRLRPMDRQQTYRDHGRNSGEHMQTPRPVRAYRESRTDKLIEHSIGRADYEKSRSCSLVTVCAVVRACMTIQSYGGWFDTLHTTVSRPTM